MRRLRLALAALALPAWLVAQQAEFPSAVEVVRIDVVALDRDERPVEGLRAADFELLEDSRPQAITSFEAVVVRGQAPEPIEVPRTGRTGRSSGRLPRLPAGGFSPGVYSLTVDVRDGTSGATVARTDSFRVFDVRR